MVLSDGKKGDVLKIISIDLELKVKKRLQDMGLTQGVTVKIMSFYSNNAYIINVRGSRVVIGKDIAEKINIEPSQCENCSKKMKGNVKKALAIPVKMMSGEVMMLKHSLCRKEEQF